MNYNAPYLFIKWFIMYAVIVALGSIAASFGLFTLIFSTDVSHLTQIILCLFMGTSLLAGKLAYDLSRNKISKTLLKRRLHLLHFFATTFFTLGLMGTIIGFCYMMHGTLNASVDVSQIISQLKVGSSTKLFTTLMGLVSSILLQAQILVIELDLINES